MTTPQRSLIFFAATLLIACNGAAAGGTDTDGGGSSDGGTTGSPTTDTAPSSTSAGTDDATGSPTSTATSAGESSSSSGAETASAGSDESSTGETPSACEAHDHYEVAFSTYFGGAEDWEHTRGITFGDDGSIFIVGGTASDDFPTTAGAYDESFNGNVDVFIAKFTPEGELEWSTLFGGPNYDRAYTVRVDAAGDVYLGGRAGPGLPTTAGSLQPNYAGFNTGAAYGQQNGFMAKLSGDGGEIRWATYVGVSALVRTFDIDEQGDIYASLSHQAGSSNNWPAWMDNAFDGAYQPVLGSPDDNGIVKIDTDGSSVEWASWIGGNALDRSNATVRVDDQHRPYLFVPTDSNDLETTPGAWLPSFQGGGDLYLARLSADGTALELGTYVGGSAFEEVETHGLALADDAVYVGFYTQSTDIETTPGAFQGESGGMLDTFVARIEFDGALSASTYLGGSGTDASDGFSVTPDGQVVIVGESNSTDYPMSSDAYQAASGGGFDGTVARLSPDLTTLVYGSYFGGPGHDNLRNSAIDAGCTVIVAGAADGPGFPTVNAIQPNFAGGSSNYGNGDNVLIRLVSAP